MKRPFRFYRKDAKVAKERKVTETRFSILPPRPFAAFAAFAPSR